LTSAAGVVGASRHALTFSNTNADVEVAAPGVNILSTIPGGQYATM